MFGLALKWDSMSERNKNTVQSLFCAFKIKLLFWYLVVINVSQMDDTLYGLLTKALIITLQT